MNEFIFDYVFIPETYNLVWGMYVDGRTIAVIAAINSLSIEEVELIIDSIII